MLFTEPRWVKPHINKILISPSTQQHRADSGGLGWVDGWEVTQGTWGHTEDEWMVSILVAEKSHVGAFLSNSLGAIPHGCFCYMSNFKWLKLLWKRTSLTRTPLFLLRKQSHHVCLASAVHTLVLSSTTVWYVRPLSWATALPNSFQDPRTHAYSRTVFQTCIFLRRSS